MVFIRDLILSGRLGALKILHIVLQRASRTSPDLAPMDPSTGGLPAAAPSWIWASIASTPRGG